MDFGIGRLRRGIALAAALHLALGAGGPLVSTAWAQVRQWQVGGSGLSWESQAQIRAGLVAEGGRLHPLELVAEQNLTRLLSWAEGQPADMTREGNPRVWDNSGTTGSLILVDGRDTTSTGDRFQKTISQAGRAFFLDLGVAFPVNRIRFYPPPRRPELAIKAYEVFGSDGKTYTDIGLPVYKSLKRVEVSDSAVVDISFPSQQTRFVQVRTLSRDAFELAEVEVYGQGFVASSSYVSQLHQFPEGPVNFGRLSFVTRLLQREGGAAGAVATARVQVRSGADDTPLTYYRRDTETGTETVVSESQYNALSVYERGPVRADADNWSPWSAAVVVDSTGSRWLPADLPCPRQYLQFRIAFAGDPTRAIQVDELAVEYSSPLADRAVGELALAADPAPPGGAVLVPAGVETTFVHDIRAEFDAASREGFRGVRLVSFPPPVFVRLEMGTPLAAVDPDSVVAAEDGFTVYFPEVTQRRNVPLRITYRNALLEYTTVLGSWLIGARGGLPQPVAAGNASGQIQTSTLQARALRSEPDVSLRLSTPVLTPNGDGVNDEVSLTYLLSQFAGDVHVRLEVCDLRGRRVRGLVDGWQSVGRTELVWDGADEAGRRVPPAVYLCRLEVDSDARGFRRTRTIGVAY